MKPIPRAVDRAAKSLGRRFFPCCVGIAGSIGDGWALCPEGEEGTSLRDLKRISRQYPSFWRDGETSFKERVKGNE